MLERVTIQMEPQYTLSTSASISRPEGTGRVYPAWDQADFILKLIRNSVSCIDLTSVESKVVRLFQKKISSRMRRLSKAVEAVAKTSELLPQHSLSNVEEMLNLGQSAVAGVYAIWHVRGNIAGTTNTEGISSKEFLKPVQLQLTEKETMELLPTTLRLEVGGIVEELAELYSPSTLLYNAAMLGHAARITAGSELRALITYNSDTNEWPASRDEVLVGVLGSILQYALKEEFLDESLFFENLIAVAVLEETIAVREPRDVVIRSYLKSIETVLKYAEVPVGRIEVVEKALSVILRLPEGLGLKIRMKAVRNLLEDLDCISALEEKVDLSNISSALGIKLAIIEQLAEQINEAKFDREVGKILMNNEVQLLEAIDAGEVFLEEVCRMANMETTVTQQRILYVASAILESFLEVALEENLKMKSERSYAMLHRAYTLSRHPLIMTIDSRAVESDLKLIHTGSKMLISRLSKQGSMELVKLLGALKAKLEGNSSSGSGMMSDWSSSEETQAILGCEDPGYLIFISALQETLIKDYTIASARGS